ncbi:hypothetical protein [Sphingomonas sp.]|uniref:hypothetical protein n=1 Tax=Sphingomonas sp. TaxID=28214 RepID=UPI0025F0651C|nr:hypothetical protein [Sphingomonas sp.]
MLRFGPDHGPVVVLLLPFFEEYNRTRAFGVAILRALEKRGIAGVLPDLPGFADSLVDTEKLVLANLQQAVLDLVASLASPVFSAAIRSAALIDAPAPARWRLSPQTGAELAREIKRLRALGDGVTVAGNAVSDAFVQSLETATLAPGQRTVRLDSDPAPADLKLPGAPLWRLAEPGDDPDLAELLAADIAEWIAACAG